MLLPDFGRFFFDFHVWVDALESPEPSLPVVDAQRLPVQHVRQSLCPVSHDYPLSPVHLGKLVQLFGQLVDRIVQALQKINIYALLNSHCISQALHCMQSFWVD